MIQSSRLCSSHPCCRWKNVPQSGQVSLVAFLEAGRTSSPSSSSEPSQPPAGGGASGDTLWPSSGWTPPTKRLTWWPFRKESALQVAVSIDRQERQRLERTTTHLCRSLCADVQEVSNRCPHRLLGLHASREAVSLAGKCRHGLASRNRVRRVTRGSGRLLPGATECSRAAETVLEGGDGVLRPKSLSR